MDCPKCGETLAVTTVRGTDVDKCPSCRGIWFDESELETILELLPSELRPLTGGRQDASLNRTQGRCPRHKKDLMRVCSVKDASIIVDVCPQCRGIWLDGGELKRLLG